MGTSTVVDEVAGSVADPGLVAVGGGKRNGDVSCSQIPNALWTTRPAMATKTEICHGAKHLSWRSPR